MHSGKTVAVMQPYFFPYIGYFQLIAASDVFVFYDDVNYINRGWINRNNILLNGTAHLITLPLEGASQNKLINQIGITSDEKQLGKLLKTVQSAYAKAPEITVIMSMLENWFSRSYSSIAEFNRITTQEICDYLGIHTKLIPSSGQYANKELKAQYRVLDICKQETASVYLNPIGGLELYADNIFDEAGIQLKFIKAVPQFYTQNSAQFVPFLSIIDYLMHMPAGEVADRLKEYQIVTK